VKLLPRYGFTFDLCLYHPQLAEVTELCRRCPEVHFVIDHIAKPGIRAGLTEPWRSRMREIARLPNVACKISGVVTEADHAAWREADVAPYVAHAIECFGFDRVMFGGDWPVSELATTYRRWVDLVDSLVAGASENERRRLYRDNAIAFYRL
jgi:L-fuconolactonase